MDLVVGFSVPCMSSVEPGGYASSHRATLPSVVPKNAKGCKGNFHLKLFPLCKCSVLCLTAGFSGIRRALPLEGKT